MKLELLRRRGCNIKLILIGTSRIQENNDVEARANVLGEKA